MAQPSDSVSSLHRLELFFFSIYRGAVSCKKKKRRRIKIEVVITHSVSGLNAGALGEKMRKKRRIFEAKRVFVNTRRVCVCVYQDR